MIIDRFIDRIYELRNPICMGIDPRIEKLPHLLKSSNNEIDAIFKFNKAIMDAASDIIPCVKLQIAFYEIYKDKGLKLFFDTAKYAKTKGFFVIADIKRADIKEVSKYYSNVYLGCRYIDGVTVNPYLGEDGISPFIEDAKKYDKLVFVIAKTSNVSSDFIQNINLKGTFVYEKVAEMASSLGKELTGRYGYSNIGIVVGATYPEELERLRDKFPGLFFLVPGYGAQGGSLPNKYEGMIINISRSLIYAFENYPDIEYPLAIRKKAIEILNNINWGIER